MKKLKNVPEEEKRSICNFMKLAYSSIMLIMLNYISEIQIKTIANSIPA